MLKAKSLNYDYLLLIATTALIVVGILFIYSSGIDAEGHLSNNEYLKQIVWAVVGFIFMLVFSFSKYRLFCDFAPIIYAVSIILLIVTLLAGNTVNGARSWLGIASFGIQPSEFMKISVILLLAFYLEKAELNKKGNVRAKDNGSGKDSIRGIATAFLIVMPPVILVLLQPDLGTAMVYIPITIVMLFAAGVNLLQLFFVIGVMVFTGIFIVLPEWGSRIYAGTIDFLIIFQGNQYFPFVLLTLVIVLAISLIAYRMLRKPYFFYLAYVFGIIGISFSVAPIVRNILHDHQMLRLLVFLDPYVDPRGAGWNIIQSVTAVGSGGFTGKGFLEGTQSHFQFLPQQSTDFIFSILAEEWGFIGGVLITGLYMVIIVRGIVIASNARDSAGGYIAVGICTMLFFHYFVSVGMAIGLMPITGIPLLFVSYGGSSLWTAMISIGLLISVSRS